MILAIACAKAKAQYDVPFSHYWGMEPYFNPASVGKESKLNVVAAYALNFAGFEHNPRTMYFGGDMPFMLGNSYHGVGLQLVNDQIGIFTHQRLSAQYAFKRNLAGGTSTCKTIPTLPSPLRRRKDRQSTLGQASTTSTENGMWDCRRSTSPLHSWNWVRPMNCKSTELII